MPPPFPKSTGGTFTLQTTSRKRNEETIQRQNHGHHWRTSSHPYAWALLGPKGEKGPLPDPLRAPPSPGETSAGKLPLLHRLLQAFPGEMKWKHTCPGSPSSSSVPRTSSCPHRGFGDQTAPPQRPRAVKFNTSQGPYARGTARSQKATPQGVLVPERGPQDNHSDNRWLSHSFAAARTWLFPPSPLPAPLICVQNHPW